MSSSYTYTIAECGSVPVRVTVARTYNLGVRTQLKTTDAQCDLTKIEAHNLDFSLTSRDVSRSLYRYSHSNSLIQIFQIYQLRTKPPVSPCSPAQGTFPKKGGDPPVHAYYYYRLDIVVAVRQSSAAAFETVQWRTEDSVTTFRARIFR